MLNKAITYDSDQESFVSTLNKLKLSEIRKIQLRKPPCDQKTL